jgi:uncharacterized Fe-S center protein
MSCPDGHEFMMTPIDFKNGHGCAKCFGNCSTQAEQQFYAIAMESGFEVIEEYRNATTKIQMQCP